MTRSTALVLCLTAALAAPAAGFAATPAALAVSAAFDPSPPRQGPTTIVVTIKDHGKPVTGAKVTIATNMPSMAMRGPKLHAQDNGDGTYAAQTNLNYGTRWTFDIQAKAGSRSGRALVRADVKP